MTKNYLITTLMIVFIVFGCNAKNSNINELIQSEMFEPGGPETITNVFDKLNGADLFISKFNLSQEEVQIVGKWCSWTLSENIKDNEEGIGLSISFLPNRLFIVYDSVAEYDNNGNWIYEKILYKLGYWKIENGLLMIKFKYIYTTTDDKKIGLYDKKQKEETDFYPIWKPEFYKTASVQKKTFDYNKVPKSVKNKYSIDEKDFIRGRYVIALGIDGWSDSLYEKGRIWHEFLMNPDIDDEKYVYNLRVMSAMSSEVSYDLVKNELNLDFTKWNDALKPSGLKPTVGTTASDPMQRLNDLEIHPGLFVSEALFRFGEDVYNEIIPNGLQEPNEIYNTLIKNKKIKKLGNSTQAWIEAQKYADMGVIVLSVASSNMNHVAIVLPKGHKYNTIPKIDWKERKGFNIPQGDINYKGIVKYDWPAFLQAGYYTGIVAPRWAYSPDIIKKKQVCFFVYENVR